MTTDEHSRRAADHPFDAISRADLDRPSSRKWSLHPGTIGAWVAESDFGTAPAVARALHDAVDAGDLGYLAPATTAAMAEATAAWLAADQGWRVDPARIHAVSDVMAAFRVAIDEFAGPGTAVIVPTPAYMPFLTYGPALGHPVIEVPGRIEGGRWRHDLDRIDAAFRDGARTLVLCNPHNPTGTVLDRAELQAIASIVERHGGRVFADEIHAPLRYDGAAHIPYASLSEATAAHTATGTSASKAWNVPGLKAAQLVLSNGADQRHYARIGFSVVHGASTLGVLAATAAYREGGAWLADVVDYLDGNRRFLAELLAELLPEIRWSPPAATYLAWLDLAPFGVDGSPADLLRERGRISVTDGALCGTGSEQHVRFVFAMPRPLLADAVRSIADAVHRR